MSYVHLSTDGYTEQGGAAALTSAGTSTDTTFTTLGVRASSGFMLGHVEATARGMIGWRHAFGNVTPAITQAFANSDPFTVIGTPLDRNSALVEAGLDIALTGAVTLGISYEGQFASRSEDQGVRGDLAIRF